MGIENSLKYGESVGGHLCSGHVHTKGVVKEVELNGDSKNILISAEGTYAQSAKWSDDESKGFIKLLGQSTSAWAKLHK